MTEHVLAATPSKSGSSEGNGPSETTPSSRSRRGSCCGTAASSIPIPLTSTSRQAAIRPSRRSSKSIRRAGHRLITRSGLRGRGGGGFLTGVKWKFCRQARRRSKYIICNADEGDPGAFHGSSTLESDPHSVLEGMMICAYAIGAEDGYIYARAEYPKAVQRLAEPSDRLWQRIPRARISSGPTSTFP